MTTEDFITDLFCRVDDRMENVPNHRPAALWPSELVTIGMLFAVKGVGQQAFYRWLSRDFGPLFPALTERDPDLVMQAVALDPLTSAVLTLDEIRRMVAEMLEAERKYLPQFSNRKLRQVPAIRVPAGVPRQEVPLDPALAIANRFGMLARA